MATDIFTIYGKNYIVVDYFSRYFEISVLNEPADSSSVILAMKIIFSRHGISKIIFSDNASQYTSVEFPNFLSNVIWSISFFWSTFSRIEWVSRKDNTDCEKNNEESPGVLSRCFLVLFIY